MDSDIQIPVTGLLASWLEKSGRTDLVDAGVAVVDAAALEQLKVECRRAHPGYNPEMVDAWAAVSILTRKMISKDDQQGVGSEAATGLQRIAQGHEAQVREFRALRGAFDNQYEAIEKVAKAVGTLEATEIAQANAAAKSLAFVQGVMQDESRQSRDKVEEVAIHFTEKVDALAAEYRDYRKYTWIWRMLVLLAILACAVLGHAQTSQISVISITDSSGTRITSFAAPFTIQCLANLTCTRSGNVLSINSTGGGGGSTAWADITAGTNTQVLVVGSSGSISWTGTGIINARKINGVEFTNAESLGKIPIGQGDGTAVWSDPLVQGTTAHDAVGTSTNPVLVGGYASAAAPTDVSADGDATRAWVLRNGALAVNITSAGALIPGDATNGLKVQVTTMPTVTVTGGLTDTQLRASAVPVSLASLPALAAGSAVIGHVIVDTAPSTAVTNAGTFAVQATLGAETTKVIGTVNIAASQTIGLSAGAAVIGHVIADSGSTTAVTGNVASTVADGANVTLGAKGDAKSTATDTTAITAMQVLKEISAMEQVPASRAVTNAGTFAVQATLAAETTKVIGTVNIASGQTVGIAAGSAVIGHVIADSGSTTAVTGNVASTVADGANVTLGAKADAKSTATDTTAVTEMQVLKEISAMEQAPASRAVTNAGTFAVQATLSAGAAVIGHVIADSGSTTAVTGNVAVTVADAADVTLGAKADAKSTATDTTAVTIMQVLKEISSLEQAPASRAVTNAGTFAVQATLAAETTKVIGTVNQGTSPWVNNTSQINGVTPLMGNGTTGTGSQRVTIASDNTAFSVNATLGTETTKVIGTVREVGNVGGVLDAATGAAPPANAMLDAGLGSGATGGFLVGVPVSDTYAAINISTATTTRIVTGVSGRQVRIGAQHMVTAAANNVAWIEGTGATCGTATAGMAGGTTAASGYNFAANGGISEGAGFGTVLATVTAGDSVCIVTSASTQLSGGITYTIY